MTNPRPATPATACWSPRKGFLRRFGRARDGAMAVEFAMVALPFLALIFATVELGMMFLVSTTLESSAQQAARTIRTGQFQSGAGTAAAYKAAVCNGMGWLGADCQANLYVDVRTFNSFGAVNGPSPIVNGAINPASMSFQAGAACSIVLARAFYNWTLLAPDLSGLAHMRGNKVLLTAAAAFRNEPFSGQVCP
jgi:Flp pilus assembly protein TadG